MTVRYVTVAEVVFYHDRLVRAEGQSPAPLMDPGKLESAVARPASEAFGEEFFPTLAEKASVLLQGIVVAHPFVDGNKRAGLAAMLLFLELNGITGNPDEDALYDFLISVTTGELRETPDIAAKLTALFPGLSTDQ